jgi:hypothetical protein
MTEIPASLGPSGALARTLLADYQRGLGDRTTILKWIHYWRAANQIALAAAVEAALETTTVRGRRRR